MIFPAGYINVLFDVFKYPESLITKGFLQIPYSGMDIALHTPDTSPREIGNSLFIPGANYEEM
jgi:hypothetical protein